ncbi:MAG: UDP-N-acetylmuramoyl-tripeptide--D-alanyl-D-alanine ligase [Salinibacterium sp.]|nr:UDP-N-acetylmuramoyl-tripeptide--D-alanyl-D-alanine ligase [Salinibacterium sp.]
MIDMSIAEIARAIGGTFVGSSAGSTTQIAEAVVAGTVRTDSRAVERGDIFFALPGEVTDGHLFVSAAVDAGAALVVAERPVEADVAQIVVADGVVALSDLARDVVSRVRAGGELKVVAVTGSNGKTTTKNMLRAILGAEGKTVAPVGSFNNEVGAPISMLGIEHDTKYLVVEMGADGVGDIAKLVSVAKPDVGIVLTVGLAHIGKFGSADAIELAKGEMVADLPPTAVAVLNADDSRVVRMAQRTTARVQWFGLSASADVRAEAVETTASGTSFTVVADGERTRVNLRILGEHHAMNALAAITAARAIGIPIERSVEALESLVRAERWRMEVLDGPDGVVIINDAYNASPDSMAAALKTLAELTRGDSHRSVAVLGEMAELGDFADDEHDRIGRLVVRLNIGQLIVVGHNARHIHNAAGLEGSWDGESLLVETADEAYALVRDRLREGDVVLVKSSKSAGLRLLGDRLAGLESSEVPA